MAEPGKCLECGADLRNPRVIGYCDKCFAAWLEKVDQREEAHEPTGEA